MIRLIHIVEVVMVKERNVGLDLLKILSMVFVVLTHVLLQGGILNEISLFSFNYGISWLLEIIAFSAVNCYALISGYVMVSSKLKYSNILRLWFQTLFYTITITGLFCIFYPSVVSTKTIIKAFFPIIFGQYWYFTSYFCMWFFIPFFNILLNKLNKKMAFRLIITIIFFFSFLAIFCRIDVFHLSNGYSLLWISSMYLLGGYLKKYNVLKNWSNKKLFLGFISCSFFALFSKFLIEILTLKVMGYTRGGMFFISYNSFIILLQSIFLVLFFSRINISKGKKIIEYLVPFSFGVYLFHAHPLIWDYILRNRFTSLAALPIYKYVIYVFAIVIFIYILSTAMDIIRNKIFKILKIKELCQFIEKKMLSIDFLSE